MKAHNSKLAVRSFSSLKTSLLSATALVAAGTLLAKPAAAAPVIYTQNGTYSDAVTVGKANSILYRSGVDAVFAGTVNYGDATGGHLFLGETTANNGTLVFAPTSLTASPAYSGVIISGGVVRFGSDAARDFYSRAGTIFGVAGGVFDLYGVSQTVYELTSLGTVTGGTITNNGADAAVLTISNSGLFAGTIADGTNTVALRKEGDGLLQLRGNNNYSGGTTLVGGILDLGHSNALGTGNLNIEGLGSVISLGDRVDIGNSIVLGDAAHAATVSLQVLDSGIGFLGGAISGTGDIFKTGTGELRLWGAHSVDGRIFINAGILTSDADAGGDISDAASLIIDRNATFRVIGQEKVGDIAGTGTVRVEAASQLTVGRNRFDTSFSGRITGEGVLRKEGDATLTLRSSNTYSGGTFLAQGKLVAAATGALGTGDLRVGAATRLVLVDGVRLDNDVTLDWYNLDVEVAGGGSATLGGRIYQTNPVENLEFYKRGSGTLVLAGMGSEVDFAEVQAGTLQVDGYLTAPVTVLSDATLTGIGTIAGNVAIDGILAGSSDQSLTIEGNLALNRNASVDVRLGAPSNAALFGISGNLTLDGWLNIEDAGGFGQGVYRLFDYGGALTDNGLEVNGLPDGIARGDVSVQTAIAHQVNIVVGDAPGPGEVPTIQFWDGANTTADGQISGGGGTWNASSTNWTDANGQANHAWGGRFAVFQGTSGVVTVDGSNGPASVTGMQFAVSGYQVNGGPISLAAPQTVIRVGDGTDAGSSYRAVIASNLTGPGGLVKDDLGFLILAGNNSYQGNTIVRAGMLAGNANSIRNNIVNNGLVRFNQNTDASFAGSITGIGRMEKEGGGTLRLTGLNTLDWVVQEGALSSTTGLFRSNVDTRDAGVMRFEQNESGIYAGKISGAGELSFAAGAGNTITLTGDSSGFTGEATVENGALAVNGRLGGTLDVLASGRLQGIGTVGDTTISGTIAPGNSIGTLNVAGDITFNPGSIYEVETNAAGQSDRINATGTATINGGTVRVLAGAGNYVPQSLYTILHADGGRSGTFAGATSNLAFLDPLLSYDANSVYLRLTRNAVAFRNVGLTRNQIAAGGGVESLGSGNAVYDAVLNLSADQARAGFDQLSGEIHASARTALIEDSRFIRNAVNDRIRAAFADVGASGGTVVTYEDGKPRAEEASTDRFAIWSEALGSWGHTDGDGNAARLNRSTGGFFIGADGLVFDSWRFGAVAGYSHTRFDVEDRHSSGSSDNYHVGLYGGTQWGAFALRTGAAYSWHDISSSRSIAFPGFSDSLKSDYGAATAQVFGELASEVSMGAARFEPFANLAYVNLHTDGFTEEGKAAALTSASANTDVSFTTLGLRASTTFDVNGANLTAKGMVGWRHAFGDVTPLSTLRFAGGGDAFTIGGVPIARDAAVVEAGLDYALTSSAVLGISYGGQFGSGVIDQSMKANFSVKF
ncbi:autotransporter domain-containing protein [Mesorhizobium sp. BAC0120]|uniref:autotransporter outer membrane beta-barrel domain-containing protein n=1 Tax=Mesorhizobium sp. BAC0120 TaxID=3090670 RepID=UPI00298D581B|nr:autotransporter domain-containing protein [Mesorhizobium sp. BAC0120]MDW6021611.1 autotransporter domain-containing protein [Mesorhizobium sp. BAC0120]